MLLRSNNNLSSTEFLEISPADEDKIGPGQVVRTSFGVKGSKVEIQWVFEYGDWRISYVNMQKFAQLLSGGGTGVAGGTGGGGTGARQPAAPGRMGLEVFGGAGMKRVSGYTFDQYWITNGSGLAWTAGLLLDIPFSPFLGMSTGALATLKGANFNNTSYDPTLEVDYSIVYLEVPLLLRAGLPFAVSETSSIDLYVDVGLGFNLAVSKGGKLSGYTSSTLDTSSSTSLANINDTAFAFLADLGVEYAFSKSLALGAKLSYDSHLADDWDSSYATEGSFSNLTARAYLKLLF
jgi:opacity protein-like surface antigen